MSAAGQQNYDAARAYTTSPDAVWSADKAAAYANPFTEQVIDRTKAGMAKNNAVELQGVGDNAAAARAFGGTRHAVLEGQVRNDQADRMGDYEAAARAEAYGQAQNSFNQERAAKLAGYQLMTQILSGTPRDVTTTGSMTGTTKTKENVSFLDKLMGMAAAGAAAYGGMPG